MNDGLDELHSDREEGTLPTWKEIVGMIIIWTFFLGLFAFFLAGLAGGFF